MKLQGTQRFDVKRCYIPARYVIILLGFLGSFNIFAIRVNLSVAMVAMVNSTTDVSVNKTPTFDTTIPPFDSTTCSMLVHEEDSSASEGFKGDQYNWDSKTQGYILGAFYYGYVLTQLPGGFLAEKIGAKWIFGGGVFVSSVCSMFIPLVASLGATALIALRVLEGFGEGVTFPALNFIISQWSPKFERSRVSTIILTGAQIGTVISMPISGWLCSTDLLGGWPSAFYVFGATGCIWFVTWSVLVYEKPSDHPRISDDERKYILGGKEKENPGKKPPVPWKAIFTSLPMWAVTVAHIGQNFGLIFVMTELPSYLSATLHFDIKSNGAISALPYIAQAVFAWVASYVADKLRQSETLSITSIRKIFNSIGMFGPAICLLGVTVSGCQPMLIVALITLGVGLNGCVYSGLLVTHVDMSPDFAGTLFGITNALSNLCGIIGPVLVGYFTNENNTRENWNSALYIVAAIYVITALFFILFCSAELQPWGIVSSSRPENLQKNIKKMIELCSVIKLIERCF